MEFLGKVADRGVGVPQLLENTTPGSVSERGEGRIRAVMKLLNHVVQYFKSLADVKGNDGNAGPDVSQGAPHGIDSARRRPLML